MLKAPEGLPAPSAPTPPGDALNKLAENIYTFRTSAGYTVLLVGMKDYVFVMEAPVSDTISRDVLAKAKDIFAGKPVKYVAVSHFHDDPAGGAHGFMSAGADLITTRGNAAFFERMRKRNSTLFSDKPVPAGVKIETVEGKRTITDGVTTVELIDIGKGPHTDEMLIAYL